MARATLNQKINTVNDRQCAIKKELEQEGNEFDIGWTYENCLLIIARLSDEELKIALELIRLSESGELGVNYTPAYMEAARYEMEQRRIDAILLGYESH